MLVQLHSASSLINAGTSISAVTVDRDGVFRPQDSGFDVGIYEVVSTGPCYNFEPPDIIDAADVQVVAGHWGEHAGDPGWMAQFDLDINEIVNVIDIMKVAAQWGQTCS